MTAYQTFREIHRFSQVQFSPNLTLVRSLIEKERLPSGRRVCVCGCVCVTFGVTRLPSSSWQSRIGLYSWILHGFVVPVGSRFGTVVFEPCCNYRDLSFGVALWTSGLLTTRDDQASSYLTFQEFGFLGCRAASGIHISTHFYKCVCVSTPVSKDTTLTLSNLPCIFPDHCTAAGACDTLILSHATKLWIRVGRETWPVSCTCTNCLTYSKELMLFVETFN